jgi:hypothetical protein
VSPSTNNIWKLLKNCCSRQFKLQQAQARPLCALFHATECLAPAWACWQSVDVECRMWNVDWCVVMTRVSQSVKKQTFSSLQSPTRSQSRTDDKQMSVVVTVGWSTTCNFWWPRRTCSEVSKVKLPQNRGNETTKHLSSLGAPNWSSKWCWLGLRAATIILI